ncbi:MAG TPA: flavin reductase family protein [Methylophilaceae bacterium]|nr:flavin reductase family protein [Methylophilaceae bacterium]
MNTHSSDLTHPGEQAQRRLLDTSALRLALGRFATGLTVATATGPDGRLAGITVNSFNAVSLDPPLVLWSLARHAGSAPVFEAASHWAVHVLAHDQSDLAAHFARSNPDKFAGLAYRRSDDGTPLLSGCAARFLCRAVHRYDGGDHIIMVGRVLQFEQSTTPALVYHDSAYAIATSTAEHEAAEPESPAAGSLGFLLGSAFFYMYGRLRDAGGKLGFTNSELFVLMALGERGWRSRGEINALLAYGGHPTNLQVLDDLEGSGRCTSRPGISGATDDAQFALTPAGEVVVAELTRASLAVMADMDDILGMSGSIALRSLLRRFVKDTESSRTVNWL